MLTISRPDIERSDITDFEPSRRFIKLPVTNYLKLLNIWESINEPQIALINAVNNPKYRFICAALARRLGKTYIANVIGQLVTLVPGSNVLIISPNYNLSTISFELQRRLIKHFDLEITRDNLKDRIIELSNGSTIRMGSLSTVDSCVGRSYDLIIFDEAALGSDGEAAFNVALRPTLDKPNSKAIFISTPRGKNNWFSRFFDRGFTDDFPEWCSITADYTENSRMAESDVAEARKSMSRSEFEQEYMASFTTFEGQIYKIEEQQICEYVILDGDEAIAGCDPGYRDPTAFVVVVYQPTLDKFHVSDEYLKAEATTDLHAAAFQEFILKWQIESTFIDSAAPQFASDLAYLYDVATIKAKKDVLPGIAYVQTLIETGRLTISPHCTHTLAMLDQYRWDTRENIKAEKPLHDEYSHMADALRYALYTYTI
jgi:phage terminase large subunit